MYLNDCLCGGLCAAHSALPRAVTVNGYIKLPKHLLLSRYLKEIYNRHPPWRKYEDIWDICKLLFSRYDYIVLQIWSKSWNYVYWLVLLFLIRIKFGHAQISVPKLGMLMLKIACINHCLSTDLKLWFI